MNYLVNPLSIATQGLLLSNNGINYEFNPFTFSINGFLVEITEEIITKDEKSLLDINGGRYTGRKKYPQNKKKLITVNCFINGKKYTQTKTYKNLNISVKDVGVEIDMNTNNKPKIKIFVHK